MRQRTALMRLAASAAVLGIALTGCASTADDTGSADSATFDPASCTPEQLATVKPDTLTIATGEPAFPPWVVDDDPTSGEGFEAAVAYAAAEQLGYAPDQVEWIRTTFDSAIAPGAKDFDWNLQQYTITTDRENAVDFSSPYYRASQVVVTTAGSPIAGATTLAELKDAKLGAAVGSTSLDDAEEIIAPTTQVAVFNDNAAAVTALSNGTIDGLVVDLPTAFYLVGAGEITDGKIVGQLPGTASGENDSFGILLENNSALTACTSWAVDQLAEDGTLAALEEQWLAAEGAPVLQ